eukprot:1511329-Pyramimonas_sp.AAC.1
MRLTPADTCPKVGQGRLPEGNASSRRAPPRVAPPLEGVQGCQGRARMEMCFASEISAAAIRGRRGRGGGGGAGGVGGGGGSGG